MSSLAHVLSDVAAKTPWSGLNNTSQKICEDKTVTMLRTKYDTAAFHAGHAGIKKQSSVYFELESVLQELWVYFLHVIFPQEQVLIHFAYDQLFLFHVIKYSWWSAFFQVPSALRCCRKFTGNLAFKDLCWLDLIFSFRLAPSLHYLHSHWEVSYWIISYGFF